MTAKNILDPSKLPPDDGLTINQVAKRCNITRDDVQTMIGVIEKHAGLLPQRADDQGQQRRIVSELLLLPYFETAAFLMRLERHNALIAMEKTLHLGANYYLERLTHIANYLHTLRDMPRELRDAAQQVRKAAGVPHTVSIQDCEPVQWALHNLATNLRHWQIATAVLSVLFLLVLLAVALLLLRSG